MNRDPDWEAVRGERNGLFGSSTFSTLQITLLFGSAAVALALIVAPLAANYVEDRIAANGTTGLDLTATGSVGQRGSYTIRRSVLQPSPDSVCIIRPNGVRSGEC